MNDKIGSRHNLLHLLWREWWWWYYLLHPIASRSATHVGTHGSEDLRKGVGGKDTLIERQRVLIEELESERVHVVPPSSLSSLSTTLQCCFHEHAKVRIRMLKMEERLKGVPKWFNASQRHPFIPRLLGIVEKEDIPLIEGIDISHMMKDDDVDGMMLRWGK